MNLAAYEDGHTTPGTLISREEVSIFLPALSKLDVSCSARVVSICSHFDLIPSMHIWSAGNKIGR